MKELTESALFRLAKQNVFQRPFEGVEVEKTGQKPTPSFGRGYSAQNTGINDYNINYDEWRLGDSFSPPGI